MPLCQHTPSLAQSGSISARTCLRADWSGRDYFPFGHVRLPSLVVRVVVGVGTLYFAISASSGVQHESSNSRVSSSCGHMAHAGRERERERDK